MAIGGAAALAAACGGNVVVDQPVTSTGAGGGTSSTTTTITSGSTSTTTTTDCNVPFEPGGTVIFTCIAQQSNCPPVGADALTAELSKNLDKGKPCEQDPDFCWCDTNLTQVLCGPDPGVEGCCYHVEISESVQCEGRPFVVEGHARTAPIVPREGFSAAVELDAAALPASVRAALARAWARDAQHEHASVASFARFVMELLALGAPADLVRAANQAIADEIRHAALCFGIASRLAGEALGPGALAVEGALARGGDAAAIAGALVREGCVGETLSALSAMEARDAATDPGVRAALDEIAEDESAHAALAWRAAAWMWGAGDPAVRAAMERAFAEVPRPRVEEVGDDGATDPRIARVYGRLSAAEQAEVMARGLCGVVRPSAAALVGSDWVPRELATRVVSV